MLGDDSKGICEFIFDRLSKFHEEHLPTDPEKRKLLDQFDCGRTAQMNRQDELIYSRGSSWPIGSNGSNVKGTGASLSKGLIYFLRKDFRITNRK
jgi:hypothetical protein